VATQQKIHPVIATAIGINVFVLALCVAVAGDTTAALDRWLTEDKLVEWMQFISFAAISGMLAYVAIQRYKHDKRISLAVLGMAGVSLLVALAACEEISWFQRVLGVQSPEFFKENNRQAETNLHNLALGSASIHKTILLKLIFLTALTHNIILPILARSRPKIRTFVESLGLYLPPISASVVYLVLVALSNVLIDHPRKGELGEMFGAVHYMATVFAAYFVGLQYTGPKVFENVADGRRLSTLFCMFMVFLVMMAWIMSASTSGVTIA
jgi:hypothetical protein